MRLRFDSLTFGLTQPAYFLGVLSVSALLPVRSFAHPPLIDYVEHQVAVTVDAANIDIEVELTFHDMRSLLERRRMDTNRDGLISPAEVRGYIATMMDTLEDGFTITLAGRAIPLSLLCDPRLDLSGSPAAMGVRHTLLLSYFGRTPRWFQDGLIRMEDWLWPTSAATCAINTLPFGPVRPQEPAALEIWLPGKSDEPRTLTLSLRSLAGAPRDLPTQHQELQHAPATRPSVVPVLRPGPSGEPGLRR